MLFRSRPLFRNLVIKSNLSIYRLTDKDVQGLQTVEFVTEVRSLKLIVRSLANLERQSGLCHIGPKPFRCALYLISLAREKGSEQRSPGNC